MIIKLYKGHNLEAYFQFNGTGTNRLNWLSRNNIMNSSYRDLPGPEISYAKIRWKDQFHSNTSLLTIFMSMNINISILKNNDYTWKINNFVEQYIRCPKVGITKCKYWWQMKLYSLKNINIRIPVLNYNTNAPLPVTEKTIIRDIETKFFWNSSKKTKQKTRSYKIDASLGQLFVNKRDGWRFIFETKVSAWMKDFSIRTWCTNIGISKTGIIRFGARSTETKSTAKLRFSWWIERPIET